MKKVLADSTLPLGSTPDGQSWATKACHPADLVTPPRGIPDDRSRPCAHLTYANRFQITPPTGLTATDTWDVDIVLRPDPICFGSFARDKTGNYTGSLVSRGYYTTGLNNRFMNPQISGYTAGATPEVNYAAMRATWREAVRDYRPTYFGATIDMDAPSLSDQGHLACCQYVYEPGSLVANGCSNATNNWALKPIMLEPFQNFTDFASMQNMPLAYNGKAKDGVYMPYKLSQDDLHFKSTADQRMVHSDWNGSAYVSSSAPIDLSISTGLSAPLTPCQDTVVPVSGVSVVGGTAFSPCANGVEHACLRGLSPQANVYVTVRAGFECSVPPASIFAPLIREVLQSDPLALQYYFGVSRQLADGYPSSYNSLGALLPVIADIATKVLPQVLPLVGTAYREIKGMFGQTANEVKKEKKQTAEKALSKAVAAEKIAESATAQSKRAVTTAKSIMGRKLQILRKK